MSERFGKYRLVRKLAVGGMAEIFLATHMGPEGFKKHVAIKRILPHLTEDSDFVTMFLDEARLVARFNHPNIVQIFELGQVDGKYFLAMEYINGISMSKVLKACAKKSIPFPIEYGAKILSYACEGLEYAHNFTDADGTLLNLIHRDVSPQNIMLTYDGVVKVLDFGIAKAVGNLYQTRTSSLKGKAAYMSPEQITQKSGLDRRSDVFSLGIVLHEFALGKRPFEGDTELELMMAIVQQSPKDPRRADANMPEDLVSIIFRALEKDRTRRYQTAREMRSDLEQFLMSRQVLVDSYTLGSFLREVMPPGDQLVGYSVPTPSRPGIRLDVDEKSPASRPGTGARKPKPSTGKYPPPPVEDAPTVLTPSEVVRPLVSPDEPTVRPLPQDAATVRAEVYTGRTGDGKTGKRSIFLLSLAVFLVAVIGAAAAFLAFGQKDDQEESFKRDAGTTRVVMPVAPEEPSPKTRDAGVVVARKDPPDAGQPEAADPGPAKVVATAPADKAVAVKKDPPKPPKGYKKKRRQRRKRVVTPPVQPKDEPPKVEEAVKVASVDEKGTLTVFSRPWTEVSIDGTSYGSTPMDGPIKLQAGVHVLELANPRQGIKHRQRVQILAGKNQTIRKNFRKGLLQVFVIPFGEVYVNGVRKGLTPLDKPIELYEGNHTLRVYCNRTGKEKYDKIQIDAGKTRTVKMDLR